MQQQIPSGMPFNPPQASTAAGPIDAVIHAITLNSVVFTVLILAGVIFLCWRYRRGSKVDRSNPPVHNSALEIVWTVIPLLIVMGMFVWSTSVFLSVRRPLPGASEIYVVGKQWMWKVQHPEGRWENNELHLPVGKPIKLTMTSEDVIHSFFVPAFRIHQDVIPGDYTYMYFTPTLVGRYPLYCAQFCGTLHSQMTGWVTVMEAGDYEKWLRSGTEQKSLIDTGAQIFTGRGCNGCHGANTSVRAPALEGIYNKPVAVQIPQGGLPVEKVPATTRIADNRYIHDSIVLPEKEVAAGFKPIMPTYKGQLTESDIVALTAYIRSLANKPRLTSGSSPTVMPANRTPSVEEYKARVGFTPANIKKITGQGSAAPK